MSEWMKSLVGYMLMSSVVMQMIPNSKYEQYVRLFIGFLLILLVLQPVLKIGSADSYLEQKVSEVLQDQENLEEQIVVQSDNFRRESEKMQEAESETIHINEIEKVQVEVTLDD